jgi:tetratricopeptide (TPR) repeat protein
MRATGEDIEQPHSIELQTLSELGLVGALLLLGFLGGVGWGAMRMRAHAVRFQISRGLLVAGLGTFVTWLAQTSVDWMHLLPGLTAFALAGAAVLLAPSTRPAAGEGGHGFMPARKLAAKLAVVLGASAVIATLVVTGASLSRQGLADLYRARAQRELAVRPANALADVNRSLAIDPDAMQSYYLKAAALARSDEAEAASATLEVALAREPDNFVTWALLGDIAVRERKPKQARGDYLRAHTLNPRDSALREAAFNRRGP